MQQLPKTKKNVNALSVKNYQGHFTTHLMLRLTTEDVFFSGDGGSETDCLEGAPPYATVQVNHKGNTSATKGHGACANQGQGVIEEEEEEESHYSLIRQPDGRENNQG